jgi:hypothetical protein
LFFVDMAESDADDADDDDDVDDVDIDETEEEDVGEGTTVGDAVAVILIPLTTL